MRKKIIFLDFDGVLTNHESGQSFDPNCVELVRNLMLETDSDIVITSSHRQTKTLKQLKRKLAAHGIPGDRVVDVTPDLSETSEEGIYIAASRGLEILQWLRKHPNIENYVILDDANISRHDENFVKTDMHYGFSIIELDKALQILNESK